MPNSAHTDEIKSEEACSGCLPLNSLSALEGLPFLPRIDPVAFWTYTTFHHLQTLQQLCSTEYVLPLLLFRRVSILTSLCFDILCFELLLQPSKLRGIKKKIWSSIKCMCWLQEYPCATAAEGQGDQLRAPPSWSISRPARAHCQGSRAFTPPTWSSIQHLQPLLTPSNILDQTSPSPSRQYSQCICYTLLTSPLQILQRHPTVWLSTVAKVHFFCPINKRRKCLVTPSLTDCIKAKFVSHVTGPREKHHEFLAYKHFHRWNKDMI